MRKTNFSELVSGEMLDCREDCQFVLILTVIFFYSSAKRSAHSKFQLQIAAREGAARGLYRETGIDVRAKLERMKPAVLRMNPPEDKNGVSLLKNENDNRLYYFLQIDDEDTVPEKPDSAPLAAPEGEADSKLKVSFSNPGIEQLYRHWFILT